MGDSPSIATSASFGSIMAPTSRPALPQVCRFHTCALRENLRRPTMAANASCHALTRHTVYRKHSTENGIPFTLRRKPHTVDGTHHTACRTTFAVSRRKANHMRVLAFVTQKGGTGKSSLAVSLAVAAQEAGTRSYLLDLDQQGTAKSWYERREAEAPEVAAIEANRVPAALAALKKQRVQLVIIDTPGVDSPATVAAMQAADLCAIPARPSIADIEATRPTV